MKRFAIAATLIAGLGAGSAGAALINVNFDRFTGGGTTPPAESTLSGPAGGLNTQWNSYADEDSTGVMVDSTGANTTVTFTTNFGEGRQGSTSNLPVFQDTLTDFGRGLGRTLTINGLTPGGLYDVWIMAYRDSSLALERLWGDWSTTNTTTSPSSQELNSAATRNGNTFQAGVNFLLFSNVQADGSGTIVFNGQGHIVDLPLNDGDDYRLGLSAFQILAVPEPSSLALLGLGGLLIGTRRRRG